MIDYIYNEEEIEIEEIRVDPVDNHANGEDAGWLLMSKSEELVMNAYNTEQRIAVGPVLIPGRKFTPSRGKPGSMTSGMIEKAFNAYSKTAKSDHKMHHIYDVDGIEIVDSWLVDRATGKMPGSGFDHVPDGTWMMKQKFPKDIWEKDIKSGEATGFSIHAKLKMQDIEMSGGFDHNELDDLLDNFNNK